MANHRFVVCIDNQGMRVSLELRKLYRLLPDAEAERHGQVRVIDESGEDYLFPASMFVPLDLPESLAERLLQAA